MKHFIITGGIGAGKTQLTNRLAEEKYVVGSPATTMKRRLAFVIARELGGMNALADEIFQDLMIREHKEKYIVLLQGFGEYFSNLDSFYWIRKTMTEVVQEVQNINLDSHDSVKGTVYDSIRRPEEIQGIRNIYPEAITIELRISPERQMDYLICILGYTKSEAEKVLAHSSEHWLDNYKRDFVLDGNRGNDGVWYAFKELEERGYFNGTNN